MESINTWVDELKEKGVTIFTPSPLTPIALRLGNENLFPASLSNVIVNPL